MKGRLSSRKKIKVDFNSPDKKSDEKDSTDQFADRFKNMFDENEGLYRMKTRRQKNMGDDEIDNEEEEEDEDNVDYYSQ